VALSSFDSHKIQPMLLPEIKSPPKADIYYIVALIIWAHTTHPKFQINLFTFSQQTQINHLFKDKFLHCCKVVKTNNQINKLTFSGLKLQLVSFSPLLAPHERRCNSRSTIYWWRRVAIMYVLCAIFSDFFINV
jgi:hypothetical protein